MDSSPFNRNLYILSGQGSIRSEKVAPQEMEKMSNKKFTKKVVKKGTVVAEDDRGDKLISAFGKTYYVRYDGFTGKPQDCCKMTPDEWEMSHEP